MSWAAQRTRRTADAYTARHHLLHRLAGRPDPARILGVIELVVVVIAAFALYIFRFPQVSADLQFPPCHHFQGGHQSTLRTPSTVARLLSHRTRGRSAEFPYDRRRTARPILDVAEPGTTFYESGPSPSIHLARLHPSPISFDQGRRDQVDHALPLRIFGEVFEQYER
jgi:hypothetical protein